MLVPLQTTDMHIDAPVSAVDERGDHQHLYNTLTCISMLVPLQNTDMHIDAGDPASMAGQAELGLPDTPPFSDKPCPQDSKPQSSQSQSSTHPPPPPPPPLPPPPPPPTQQQSLSGGSAYIREGKHTS